MGPVDLIGACGTPGAVFSGYERSESEIRQNFPKGPQLTMKLLWLQGSYTTSPLTPTSPAYVPHMIRPD